MNTLLRQVTMGVDQQEGISRRMRTRGLVTLLASAIALCVAALAASGFDERVEKLSPAHRKWLEEEVVYIITDKERELFLSLQSVEERERLIEAFWQRRDPDRTTPQNEFKDEHSRRLQYANETFNRQTSRAGWQTDQGRIYITLGAPREREKFEAHYNVVNCELWTYQAPPGSILPPFFHLLFYKLHDVGEYELYSPLADGPLRLVRGIDRFTVDPMVAVRELLDISPNLAHASLTYDMSESPDFQTGRPSLGSEIIVARVADAAKRSVRTDYVDAWLRYGNKVSAEYSFNFIPSRSVFSVLAGPQRTPFVHYRLEVDPQNFRLVGEENGSRYYTILDVSLEVTTHEGRRLLDQNKEIYIELTPDEIRRFDASPFAYQDDFPLVPGDYRVTAILRNRAASQYTVAERELTVASFSSNEPGLSDIVLGYESATVADDAESEELRTFQIGKKRVQPAADDIFFIGETAHAFFQVLDPGMDWQLRFEITGEERVIEERLVPLEKHLPGAVDEPFPLTEIAGGSYRLRVVLLDANGEPLAEKTAPLNVSARNPLPRAWVHSRSFDTRTPGALALAMGTQFQVLGRHEEAARALGEAVLADPEKAEARWRLAGIHLGWHEPDAALSLLLPLEEAHGDQYEIAAGLGFAFYMKSDWSTATRYMEKAISIRPPTTGILNALAECHERLGHVGEAKELWQRSLELDPKQETIREKLATMDDGAR